MTRTRKPRKGRDQPPEDDDNFFEELLNEPDEPVQKKSKGGWPDDVPILTGDDLVWNWSDSHGRHDLAVWLERTFNPEYPLKDTKRYAKAYRGLCQVITERFKKKVTQLWLFLEFTKKNKLPCKEWQAACWNEMLSRLGYEVPRSKTKDPGFKRREE